MSEPWEVFRRAWEHGFNVGYLQGYIPFVFILNRYYYFSSNGIELEDVYRKLAGEGFFDWYLDRNALWKRTDRHYILNTLIPELVNLYGDYVMQIVQYAASLADISLAILTRKLQPDYHNPIPADHAGIFLRFLVYPGPTLHNTPAPQQFFLFLYSFLFSPLFQSTSPPRSISATGSCASGLTTES